MAKFKGIIAYSIEKETSGGIWDRIDVTKEYKGDVIKNRNFSLDQTPNQNDPIQPRHSISIIAPDELLDNIQNIRYVVWNNQKWTIRSISEQPPRLILDLGGPYNA